MAFMQSLVGGKSGNEGGAGMNYNAGRVDPIQGATKEQADTAYQQTQDAIAQQQAFVNAMNGVGQSGINNQGLAGNLMAATAQGQGPNPAQLQYQQNINQIAQQQAGAMASQKGINPALQARLIAQQGSAAGQNAAGQAATLQAQQQLAAQSALGNIGAQQIGEQANALGGYNQAAQGQQQNILNGIAGFNNANVGMQSNINSSNAAVSSALAKGQTDLIGGFFKGASGAAAMAHGGEVPGGPVSGFAKFMQNYKSGGAIPGQANVSGDSLKNDTVPAMLSPGEVVIPRSVMQSDDPVGNAAKFVAALKAKKRA